MNRRSLILSLLTACAVTAGLPTAAHAQYTNGQPASVVIGQASFTANTVPASAAATTVKGPNDVAVDPTSGKVFVADTAFNRILRFSSAAALASGTSAEYAFGQASLTTSGTGTTLAAMDAPSGVFVDSAGTLWVADTNNNRVLYFNAAATFSGTPTANGQLGTGTTSGTSTTLLKSPTDVFVSGSGAAYVADRGNSRVLRFSSPKIGNIADGLFGQSNFLAGTAGAGSAGLNGPTSAAVDASGNLWVADTSNNRVLRFANAASAVPGAAAANVLGQTDFTTVATGLSSSQLNAPKGITVDLAGRLYVSDSTNNRVLIFNPAALATNGSAASFVFGQPNFTANSSTPITQQSLSSPLGLGYGANGYVWVADSSNNRVLSYAIAPGSPQVTAPAETEITAGKTRNVVFKLKNVGAGADSFAARLQLPSTTGKKIKTLKVTYGGTVITSQLKAGTFKTPEVAAGRTVKFTMQVTPRNNARGGFKPKLQVTSVTSSVSETATTKIKITAP